MSQGKDKCGEIRGKMEEKRKRTRQGGERRVQKWKESTETWKKRERDGVTRQKKGRKGDDGREEVREDGKKLLF